MPWPLLLPEKDPKRPHMWLHILDEASEGKSSRRESERRMGERRQRIEVKPEAEEERQRQRFCPGNQNRKEERVGPGEDADAGDVTILLVPSTWPFSGQIHSVASSCMNHPTILLGQNFQWLLVAPNH